MAYIKRFTFNIIRFLREVKIEMKRVNWLNKREVLRYTALVVGVSIAFAIYLGGLDFLFTWLLSTFVL